MFEAHPFISNSFLETPDFLMFLTKKREGYLSLLFPAYSHLVAKVIYLISFEVHGYLTLDLADELA